MPAIAQVPDASGRFGPYGGRYVPETLTHALDELHRISEVHKGGRSEEAEPLAERLLATTERDSRVDKVAKRDMGRMDAVDRDVEGEFTRSLPKKSVEAKRPSGNGDEWEATSPPPDDVKRPKKPRLEDLLSPE